MSPGSRRSPGDKGSRSSWRRRKNEVSIADRLNQPPKGRTAPPGSVLPGQDMGQGRKAEQEKPRQQRGVPPRVAASDRRRHRSERPERCCAVRVMRPRCRPRRASSFASSARPQKRNARQRWLLTAVAVIAVMALGVVLVVWLSGRDGDEPAPTGAGRVEQTLTMTLAADNKPATSGALMINDPTDPSAASVLIPSRLFVEGVTPDGLPFSDTVLLGDDAAPGNSLEDTLDVVVDDTWQVSDEMLEKLVNDVGGVLVDVDVDVVVDGKLVVSQGDSQLLKGKQAVAYATYLGGDEVEELRLARFGAVLDQLMRELPDNRDTLIDVFNQVGAVDRATLNAEELADFALEYGEVARSGDAAYQTLPVTVLSTSGSKTALTVDPEGLDRLRDGLLADSLPPDVGGEQIAVFVQNGVGTPGLVEDAAELLRNDGYDFVNGGNANQFGVKQTVVFIPDSSPASQTLGKDVASTLGVPESAVEVSDEGSSVADVIVVLGEDFKP